MLSFDYKDKQFHIGDTIRVKYNIEEGGKVRVQAFEGILIATRGRAGAEEGSLSNKTFTVRKIGDRGVGIERIWPVDAKSIVDIEVVKAVKKVRRSKLYYLRALTGKMATRV
jgi:large subunit ribosomal protein L19